VIHTAHSSRSHSPSESVRARPRRTERAAAAHEDPDRVFVALGGVSIVGACTIGLVGALGLLH
jgi:hypothetical protein